MKTILSIVFCLLLTVHGYSQNIDKPNKKAAITIDELIATQVSRVAEDEFDKRMSFMKIVIDDIARLCDLKQQQKQELVLAAKGAASRSMDRWHEQAVHHFETRVGNADLETAKQILANIGNVSIGRANSDRQGESEDVWESALLNILNDEQISKYDLVRAQRKQAKIDSFASMALALLDNYLRLTPEQKAKLSPIVQQSASNYLEEIQSYWGLEKNMLMSLVNAADKDTLTAILSENQYTRLRSVTSNLDHFWDQRRREKKQ